MSSGAGTGVVVEGGLEVGIDFGEDEADEADGGVAAATRRSGAKPLEVGKLKRKRSKIDDERVDLIAKRRERSRVENGIEREE